MAIASDSRPASEVDRPPALLDHPQPLGILPTRRFWRDPENFRIVRIPHGILVGVLLLVVHLLNLPWWGVVLAIAGGIVLMQGLFERCIRQAAKRRFRSRPEPPALAEVDAGDGHSPTNVP